MFDYSKIIEKSGVITDYWTNNLLDLILRKDNLNEAYKQVKRNKGKGGIDGMQVDELLPFLRENQEILIQEIREGRYGMLERTEVGMPQGGPLSPLLSNVMLNELDKELESRGGSHQ